MSVWGDQNQWPPISRCLLFKISTGWWFHPLWKILANWKDYPISYTMEKLKMFQTTNQSIFYKEFMSIGFHGNKHGNKKRQFNMGHPQIIWMPMFIKSGSFGSTGPAPLKSEKPDLRWQDLQTAAPRHPGGKIEGRNHFLTQIYEEILVPSYPLVNIQRAIENGPVEIVSCPMQNCDFP